MRSFMKRIVLGSLLGLVGCNPAPKIQYTPVATVVSPAAQHELIVVRQDPGALGSLSTAVFVRAVGEKKLGERIFVAKGQPRVKAEWSSETHARILHTAKQEDVFSSKATFENVTIEYGVLEDSAPESR